jgi:acyl-ACP thioesterase
MDHAVRSYDVDLHGEATAPALCRFMQETAMHHAEHLDLGQNRLAAMNMAWVLVRLRFRLSAAPAMGAGVTVTTWPSGIDRLFFYRDFRIVAAGAEVMATTTAWFVIDLASRTRQHPDKFFHSEFPLGEPLFPSKPARLKGIVPDESGPAVPVLYSDLDVNAHVNNVRYLEWVLDGLPLEFHQQHQLREAELNYMAEAVGGDEVRADRQQTGPFQFAHRIVLSGAEEKELLRARTVWEARG